jgi:RNA polymerase sigma-70 factor (ECF subfamily)
MCVPMVVDDPDPAGPWEGPIGSVSFTEFYEVQYRAVVRLAAAVVGRWDIAEELVQDAFVALHGRWVRVSQYESPEQWLRRVVLNRSLSALRRRAVEVRLLARLSRQRERHVEVPSAEGEIWRAVAALPKRQAQAIALMFVDDLSVGEIASVLECDETTVRTHLRRARQSLAQRLSLEEERSP